MATQQLEELIGEKLVDNNGDKIGKINDIYLDDQTNEPEWIAVHTGLFGTSVHFVPMQGVTRRDDAISVPFTAEQVKSAPNCDADGALSQSEEASLYAHYGLNYSESQSDSGLPGGTKKNNNTGDTDGYDTSGPTTDNAMTRSEEEMRVSKTTNVAGKARLRKYLVTEQRTVTVPVTREEVRIEREPITDANVGNAMSGPDLSEEEHEVVLHEEQAVVDKQVVPKERVRLAKDQITEEERVSADLTKEEIAYESDDATTTNKK